MAALEEKITFSGKSDREVYEAAITAAPKAGLEVWKTREIARLVLAKGMFEGEEVRCNIVVSMVDGSTTITAESDELGDDVLGTVIQGMKEALTAELG